MNANFDWAGLKIIPQKWKSRFPKTAMETQPLGVNPPLETAQLNTNTLSDVCVNVK